MPLLGVLLRVSVTTFMIGSLGGVGLGLPPRDALAPLKDWRFVAVGLAASWATGPPLAYLLLRLVPLDDAYSTGMLLLALAPCAPFAPAMVRRAGGDVGHAVAFVILSALATVVIMPLGAPLVSGLSVHPSTIARPLLLWVLLPMALGIVLSQLRPQLARRVRPIVTFVTNVAGVAVVVLVIVLFGRGVLGAIGSYAIALQTLFLAAATLAADLLARWLPPHQRMVVTIGTWSRNIGAALAPLAALRSDSNAMVMIAISALITLALSPLVLRGLSRRIHRADLIPV
jgi:bile acid:Na+ symporter, BASS family